MDHVQTPDAALVDLAFAGELDFASVHSASVSFSALATFRHCELAYALKYVCGLESPSALPVYGFGSASHRTFEAFTRLRRERAAAGQPPPDRATLEACFAEAIAGVEVPSRLVSSWRARLGPMLEVFLAIEELRGTETIGEEVSFRFELAIPGGDPILVSGCIDRIDRLPSGGVELIDYKTGPLSIYDDPARNLQLGIYALACRDALGLGTPERATLYFVEHALLRSAPVTEERLEAVGAQIVAGVRALRASHFPATENDAACARCDFLQLCADRARAREAVG